MNTARNGAAVLQRDAWLEALLGRPTFSVVPGADARDVRAALPNPPVFVSAKLPIADMAQSFALQDIGFRVVDTALTFACAGPLALPHASDADETRRGICVRYACSDDAQPVCAVGGSAFRYSRFHLDPLLPDDKAHAVKAAWAANYFRGARGDGMIVAESDGRVIGFLQLIKAADGYLVIDLIAVDENAARRGAASAMISFAGRHGLDQVAPPGFRVGTQAANIPSCRLYESLGFRLQAATQVLHYHAS